MDSSRILQLVLAVTFYISTVVGFPADEAICDKSLAPAPAGTATLGPPGSDPGFST